MIKVHGHTAFTSKSGYGSHARNFFTALNKFAEVKINDTYFADEPLTLEQNLMVESRSGDFWPWHYGTNFNIDSWNNHNVVDIVLSTTGASDFYNIFKKHKVAYNVWESTEQPQDFFNQLLKYDQLWVPSLWQKECSVNQGYPEDRVIIVPEGINLKYFKPLEDQEKTDVFKFVVFGKWEDRKSTKEIITSFLNEFNKNESVELYLAVDNNWPVDKYKSTEERLKNFGFFDKRIKVLHYLSNEQYLKTLQQANCFVSCSRSEGWNIPLMEAIACGVPTIATNWGAPLDFCCGISYLVDVKSFEKPKNVYGFKEGTCPGVWAEPDFKQLQQRMRFVYENYENCKLTAISDIKKLEKFSWENIAKNAYNELKQLIKIPYKINENNYMFSYHDGTSVTINGNNPNKVNVKFINDETNTLIYESNIRSGEFAAPSAKYYVKWRIEITDGNNIITEYLDLENKNVLIALDSNAIGDTTAWVPYCEKFQEKHNCNLFVRTFHNYLYEKSYPNLKFVDHETPLPNLVATYKIGVFDNDDTRNKVNWKTIPLQRVCSDILGLEYEEIIPKIYTDPNKKLPLNKKYVAISEHGSATAKFWHYKNGWQQIVDYLKTLGYEVMIISKEKTNLSGIIDKTDQTIEETLNNIKHAEFYIGVASGPSWLAYGLNKKVVLISGFSQPWTEFLQNCYRVINKSVCHGCYNKAEYEFDRRDPQWCPAKKDFECTKSITPEMVKEKINKLIKDLEENA